MLAPSSDWLRAGLGLKLNQLKLATRSYLRDRTGQATDTVISYAIAAGLFAASGVFLLAACLVGFAALFRWVELTYGRFPAFGVVGALLLVIAGICAVIAYRRLKRPAPHFPSLASRLRVAVKSSPLRPDQVEAVRDAAAATLRDSSSPDPRGRGRRPPSAFRRGRDARDVGAGLILTATLLGWAVARRRRQAGRMQS